MTHRPGRVYGVAALLLVGAVGSACSDESAGSDSGAGAADGDTAADAATASDGAVANDGAVASDGSLAAYCEGAGPPVEVASPGEAGGSPSRTCLGRIAEDLFRAALCSCTDASVDGSLQTDSFDSRDGTETDDSGAPVGVNGRFEVIGGLNVGGTTTVAGSEPLTLSGGPTFNGDLRVQGGIQFAGTVDVARDLRTAGDIGGAGLFTVGRDLYQPAGATRPATINVAGSVTETAVSVAPPCACGDDDILDIDGIVAAAATDNHNEEAGFDPTSVSTGRVELPCGRLYVPSIEASGSLTLVVEGRTALFVDGDFNVTGSLEVELEPGAELDLFVSGNFRLSGSGVFGLPDRPAAVRVYVGGDATIELTGSQTFGGNLYAPRAEVTTSGSTVVYGAIFAHVVTASGTVAIHYDRAILDVGEDCDTPPPDTCTACGGCAGSQACVGGMCTTCGGDGDCCAELVCREGACVPLLL